MKVNKIVLGLLALSSSAAFATVSLTTQFGVSTNSGGAPVPDGTLWVMIVDTNGDSALPQLAVNSGISVSLQSPFWYSTLSIGAVLANDTVFAMGAFNGAADLGTLGSTANAAPGLALTAGRAIGFYWFPGVVYTAPGSYAVGQGSGEVGGINTLLADAGSGTNAMIVPADGSDLLIGANTSGGGNLGGSLSESQFLATAIIPETSTALLGALGALGLLRRRR
jgi:hypothetical protein